MKLRILKKHFDAAVRQPWNTNTCLIAQADISIHGETDALTRGEIIYASQEACTAMNDFDVYFKLPGDEQKPELQSLRASLPITVEIP